MNLASALGLTDAEDYDYRVPSMLDGAMRSVQVFNNCLAQMGFVQGIDEIAWLFPNDNALNAFTKAAVREESIAHFNGADDHVHVGPLDTCYDVRYEFFSIAGRNYRVEAMTLQGGFSPLHVNEFRRDRTAKAYGIHASFKCPTEEDYAIATHRLREAEWEVAQKCESAYGRFSYWQPTDSMKWLPDGPIMYLKPRVNLRDDLSPLA